MAISRSRIDRLGKRLARPGRAEEADLDELRELLLDYEEARIEARGRVEQVCGRTRWDMAVSDRPKAVGTIVEKLQRTLAQGHHPRLSSIRDIAGVRTTGPVGFGLNDQDRLAELLVEAFADEDKAPEPVLDRRTDPRSGYRAVHLIVHVGRTPVEIQVRTRFQDRWANLYEITADRYGRGIRYDEPPAVGARDRGAAKLMITSLHLLSEAIYRDEHRYRGTLPPKVRKERDKRFTVLDGRMAVLASDLRELHREEAMGWTR